MDNLKVDNRSQASRKEGSRETSLYSEGSEDRFSIKEINKLRRMVKEKEKEERRNNIVIKVAKPIENLEELKE